MSKTVNVYDDVFDGEPILRWERSLGLVKPDRPQVVKRILFAVLIGWVPLAVLAAMQLAFLSDDALASFFYDFGVHARFLVAIPALILADAECIPVLGKIVNHFSEAGLIAESDKTRFEAAVSSTRRLSSSTVGHVVIVVLAYAAVAAVSLYVSTDAMGAWHRSDSTGRWHSLAGWWHALVSLPFLLTIVFGWFFRFALWTRFLFLMTKLDLRLIPGHPDGTGGLKFVSMSLRGFRFFSFALGAIVAGYLGKLLFLQGVEPVAFRDLVTGLMIFLLILLLMPLTLFLRKLRQAKRRGIFEYGGLARAVGMQFEEAWLRSGPVDETALRAPDFSATADLYSVAGNAYGMRELPFGFKDLIGPIGVSAMLPFLPLALLAMPLADIFRRLVRLVL